MHTLFTKLLMPILLLSQHIIPIQGQVQETIDLQWSLCDSSNHTVLSKLNASEILPYKANNITYYDTNPPIYNDKGLAFRTKVHHNISISMIKARFADETSNVPTTANCVWDRYGDTTFFTCSMASNLTSPSPSASPSSSTSTFPSRLPPPSPQKGIWSPSQISFATRYHAINWTALVPYGPYLDPKWKLQIAGYNATFDDVMAWTPDGRELHLMEIEVKANMSDGKVVYDAVTRELERRGVVLCSPVQRSKTSRLFRALEGRGMEGNGESGREDRTEERLSYGHEHDSGSKQAILKPQRARKGRMRTGRRER